jgi:hypothetical protein
MEINVDEHAPLEEDKNYTNIVKYTYSALCLLGKSDNPENHTEPCFPVSRVEPYEFSIDSQNDKFSELMTQFKEELSVCFESLTNDDAAQTCETSSEENSLTTIYQDADQDLAGVLGEQGCVGHNGFSATYNTKREAIEQALPEEIELDEDNQPIVCVHYWLCDFDDKYAYVERNEWRRESGHTSKKGRFEYEFDEDNIVATISGEFVEVFVRWLTKEEVDVIEENREKYNELISYREDRERQDREAEFDKAIEEFEYLSEIEEFSNIYDNRYSYSSIDDLKDACYLIKGKYSITSTKAKQSPQEPILAIGDGDIAPATLHERFHQRFGKKKH